MTSSGTIGQTTIDVATTLDHAFRRAGISPAEQTVDQITAARQNLYFYLSSLANLGTSLWTIEESLIGLVTAQKQYGVGVGVVDIKNAVRRTLNMPSGGTAASSAGGTADNAFDQSLSTACTQSSANGNISYTFASSTKITTVGFMANGDQTYQLIYEYNDGTSWKTLVSTEKKAYSDRVWQYEKVLTPKNVTQYRVRELSGGVLDAVEVCFATTAVDIMLGRLNIDQYTSLTNKDLSAELPLNYWYDRQVSNPQMHIWPAPSTPFGEMIVVWCSRQIQDVGSLSNTLEVPQRWINAIITNLAALTVLSAPKADLARYNILKEEAERATFQAQQEERDRSPFTITPSIRGYTR